MEYFILALCFIFGMTVEFFLSRKRERLIAEGKIRDLEKEALFVFGRVPSETVAILSGLRVLFLVMLWGCAVGLVVINISEKSGVPEYLFSAALSAAVAGITFLLNFAVRCFREAGIFFLGDGLVYRRFCRREVRYHDIRQTLGSGTVAVRFNFLRVPSVSGGMIKIPVADLRSERNSYMKLRLFLEETHGIRFPEI